MYLFPIRPLAAIALVLFIHTCAGAQDTIRLFYENGATELTADHKRILSERFSRSQCREMRTPVRIIGYADKPGTRQQNRTIADLRAQNVQAFLTYDRELNPKLVRLCQGDPKPSAATGRDFRKVELLVGEPPKPDTALYNSILRLKAGQTVSLPSINFEPGTATLLPTAMPALKTLYAILQQKPKMKIRLEGHICCFTDKEESDEKGIPMSRARAKTVYDYLAGNRIDTARLSYVGFGGSRHKVAIEKTEADRAANRRVEVRMLSQ